jgi:NADPH-dependent 2,4-dienoyl-CoA reductase/sulfur reductase-like enzyme
MEHMTEMKINRRRFAMLGAAAMAAPMVARAQTRPRVVVIGGGAGGATCARYLAKDSGGQLDVTLVEMNPVYATCFFSNLYLGGFRDWEGLNHDYERLSGGGVRVAIAAATGVDRVQRKVTLSDGATLDYDRLVLSPGIDLIWNSVPGYSEAAAEIAPHAYKAGPQTRLLKAKLDALEDGQNIVMIAPPNPYRCPPGPYERVSMMAHQLKSTGRTASKIFVLDPKESFSKQALFTEGWTRHYGGMVEWLPASITGGVENFDPATGTVTTGFGDYVGALVNVIPAQRAGAIAQIAGVTNEAGWAPIDPASMRSTVDPNVYVLGDATVAGDMPKSGFSANSQAKVASMTIRAELTGSRAFPARYANTCWSLIAPEDGVKVGAQYQPTEEKIASVSSFISETGESDEVRRATYEESIGWYAGIVSDMFGA